MLHPQPVPLIWVKLFVRFKRNQGAFAVSEVTSEVVTLSPFSSVFSLKSCPFSLPAWLMLSVPENESVFND